MFPERDISPHLQNEQLNQSVIRLCAAGEIHWKYRESVCVYVLSRYETEGVCFFGKQTTLRLSSYKRGVVFLAMIRKHAAGKE